jgi:hypothetical protein
MMQHRVTTNMRKRRYHTNNNAIIINRNGGVTRYMWYVNRTSAFFAAKFHKHVMPWNMVSLIDQYLAPIHLPSIWGLSICNSSTQLLKTVCSTLMIHSDTKNDIVINSNADQFPGCYTTLQGCLLGSHDYVMLVAVTS